MGYILLTDENYKDAANEFAYSEALKDKKRLLFNWGYNPGIVSTDTMTVVNVTDLPSKETHFMEYRSLFRKYYETDFNVIKWLNKL